MPIASAFHAPRRPQCGFCTPAMVLTIGALLEADLADPPT